MLKRIYYLLLLFTTFAPSSAASYEEIARVGSCFFEHKKPSMYSGAYVAPNEYNSNYYAPVLQNMKGGLLVSVGTFRSLIVFGLGNFEYGVLADYDGGIVAFNEQLLNLISAIASSEPKISFQRLQFISVLGGVWQNQKNLTTIDSFAMNSRAKIEYLLKQIPDNFTFDDFPLSMPPKVKEVLTKIKNLPKNDIIQENVFEDKIERIIRYIKYYYEPETEEEKKIRGAFFWENDDQWHKIVQAIRQNRIAVIARDISKMDFYQELKECLTGLKSYVSVLDFSNILEGTQYVSKEDKRLVADAIVSLPQSNQAKLFITMKSPQAVPIDEHIQKIIQQKQFISWTYYSIDLSSINLIEKF